MRTLKTQQTYKKLARKYNVSEKLISDIDHIQFELLAEIISKRTNKYEGVFPSIRLPAFGLFVIPHIIREKIKLKYPKKEEDESISDEKL